MSAPLRTAVLVLPVVGAGLLIAAEFSTLYEVRAVGAPGAGRSFSAGGNHGYALGVMGIAIAAMALAAALGGSRPAAAAVLVLALAALAIALAVDLPDAHETGLIGENFDTARAEPRSGLYLELAGGSAALLGGALLLLALPRRRRPARRGATAAAG